MVAVLLVSTAVFTSCYKFSVVTFSSHEIAQNDKLTVAAIVEKNGDVGGSDAYFGLFAVRVPSDWTSDEVPTVCSVENGVEQGVLPMTECEGYATFMNRFYPKEGYRWIGFSTEESLNYGMTALILTINLRSGQQTGDFRLDFATGGLQTDPKMLVNDNGELDLYVAFGAVQPVKSGENIVYAKAPRKYLCLSTTIGKDEYERQCKAAVVVEKVEQNGEEYVYYPEFFEDLNHSNFRSVDGAAGCNLNVKVVSAAAAE